MNTEPNRISITYKSEIEASRRAAIRALNITLATIGVIVVTFFGLRMCNQPAKAAPVARPIQAQQDFDYFKAHSSSNAAVKFKYDQMAGGK